ADLSNRVHPVRWRHFAGKAARSIEPATVSPRPVDPAWGAAISTCPRARAHGSSKVPVVPRPRPAPVPTPNPHNRFRTADYATPPDAMQPRRLAAPGASSRPTSRFLLALKGVARPYAAQDADNRTRPSGRSPSTCAVPTSERCVPTLPVDIAEFSGIACLE